MLVFDFLVYKSLLSIIESCTEIEIVKLKG